MVGILGLLGSDHDGERAAAGLLASRLLRDRGLCWADLIPSDEPRQGARKPKDDLGPGLGWRTALAFCRRFQGALSDWEAHFVGDMGSRRTSPTPRQIAKLCQIAEALRARGFQ